MEILTFILSVAPSILLIIYTKNKSNYNKQPTSILVKLFFYSMLTAIPTIVCEELFQSGYTNVIKSNNFLSTVVFYIFGVGLVEEFFKFVVLYLVTKFNDKYFKCLYDGIIYSVCAALGFAVLENLIYTFIYFSDEGLSTALFRAIEPGHFLFSIFMGIFFAEAKKYENNNQNEYIKYIILTVAIPSIIHGLFDALTNIPILFLIFVIALYIFAFKQIKKKANTIFFI